MLILGVALTVLAISGRSSACFFWVEDCEKSTTTTPSNPPDTRTANSDERIVNNPPGGANTAAPLTDKEVSDLFDLLSGGNTGVNTGTNPGVSTGINTGVNAGVSTGINAGINTGINTGVNPGAQPSGPACSNGGVCVPYYLCNEGDIITDGAGLIDIRLGNVTTRSSCPQFLDVCCNNPHAVDPVTPAPYTPQCGRRNFQGIDVRITGFKNNEAQYAEYPWMAAVLRVEGVGSKEANLYVCGGSLIHPNIVLTAAHCVFNKAPDTLKVRLGEWDTQKTQERHPHQDRYVIGLTIHPAFNTGALYNDFALLFLDSPAELASNVDTVCLPNSQDVFSNPNCIATGWGRDEFGKEGKFQNVLKRVDLPMVDNYNCQEALRSTRLGSFFQLDDSFVCAGGVQGLDTCKGDGGSPLVCEAAPGSGVYVQAGIVAWGIGCGEGGVPGVYANVPFGSDWIKSEANIGLQNYYNIGGYDWGYSF